MQIANKTSPKYICFVWHMTMSWCSIPVMCPPWPPSHRKKKESNVGFLAATMGRVWRWMFNGPKNRHASKNSAIVPPDSGSHLQKRCGPVSYDLCRSSLQTSHISIQCVAKYWISHHSAWTCRMNIYETEVTHWRSFAHGMSKQLRVYLKVFDNGPPAVPRLLIKLKSWLTHVCMCPNTWSLEGALKTATRQSGLTVFTSWRRSLYL